MRTLEERFREALPRGLEATLRFFDRRDRQLNVHQGVMEPPRADEDRGFMVTVRVGDGLGYAASNEDDVAGIRQALERARRWAELAASKPFARLDKPVFPTHSGSYRTPARESWTNVSFAEKRDLLFAIDGAFGTDPRLVDRRAGLWNVRIDTLLFSSFGARIEQNFEINIPVCSLTAHEGDVTLVRTLHGGAACRQGGFEIVREATLPAKAATVREEALALLSAPNCPSGKMDLILAPDQMYIQIHESIGHPLELDRILGDERNYAGTSFVTKDMFGTYQYWSELLNVVFDPQQEGSLAGFAFDDDGMRADRCHLIERGVLKRGLGGQLSQLRSGIPGSASTRACSWNRPPIDRMANINIEPGHSTRAELIASVERGVLMETNVSWSIDDSRNKFQFGCEIGRLIVDGEEKGLVRNPNYRGISANFWRNLAAIGDQSTYEVHGTMFCGKGEPNQSIFVGHASPMCLFRDVEVFGGGA